MSRKAGKAMRRILAARPSEYDNVCIMGTPEAPKEKYSRFLYYDKNGMPTVALHWEKYMKHALEKYNQIYKEELPEITPHICRHTYATIKVADGMSPKTLQHLMGHESIETTMQYYVHWNQELTEAEVARLDELNDCEDDDDDLDET
ncbi:MAG: tyrosine-type recombinase/integrase [Solobacterium sp.]|nr:tyrosine-type recombinase/integrase [Solobacterium sp.]